MKKLSILLFIFSLITFVSCKNGSPVGPNNIEETEQEQVENSEDPIIIGTWEKYPEEDIADWIGEQSSKMKTLYKDSSSTTEKDSVFLETPPDSISFVVERLGYDSTYSDQRQQNTYDDIEANGHTGINLILEAGRLLPAESFSEEGGGLSYYIESPFSTENSGDISGSIIFNEETGETTLQARMVYDCEKSYSFPNEDKFVELKVIDGQGMNPLQTVFVIKATGLIETAEQVMSCSE